MNRRIYYIDCYKGENKERNIGFIKIEGSKIFIMLRGLSSQCENKCSIYIIDRKGNKIPAASAPILRGYGQAEFAWPDGMNMGNCLGLIIPLYDKYYGKCVINPIKSSDIIYINESDKLTSKNSDLVSEFIPKDILSKSLQNDNLLNTTSKNNSSNNYNTNKSFEINSVENSKICESDNRFNSSIKKEEIENVSPDKWVQLCSTYPQVHIFPEAETIVLKPKDLVVLTKEYQKFAVNSFVLHSYYNYRQLLLLRYHNNKNSKADDVTYYLGVPGIYYERERRIALMFGFEGFENGESRLVNESSRQAYTGCFGYYMKQVEI